MYIDIELYEVFNCAENINVYDGGKILTYSAQDEEYKRILASWYEMIDGAHQMPAYGVSLNRETVVAMKEGLWLEFEFGKIYESDGMPYKKLLINVQSGFSGFNLIRYNAKTGYDGRCFYYDLINKNMANLHDLLSNF